MLLADRSDMLATALRSPDAAKAHDRAGWLALFTADGVTIDPVGSRPHRGRDALGKFYDTFIGPRDITFSSDADVVSGSSVFRDVTIAVAMSAAVTVNVPTILRYDLAGGPGALHISQLRAYWELSPMIGALLRTGLAAAPVSVALSRTMLRNQGISGAVGFLTGVRRPARGSVGTLRAVLDAGSTGDQQALDTLVRPSVVPTVNGVDVGSTNELVDALHGARGRKFITAGTTVAAVLDHDAWQGFIFAEFERSTLTSLEIVAEKR